MANLLTALLVVTAPRRHRLETELALSALPELRAFVQNLSERYQWASAMADRLNAVTEETLLTLLRDEQDPAEEHRRLLVIAYREG